MRKANVFNAYSIIATFTLLIFEANYFLTSFYEKGFGGRGSDSIAARFLAGFIVINNLAACFVIPILVLMNFRRTRLFFKIINLFALLLVFIYVWLGIKEFENG